MIQALLSLVNQFLTFYIPTFFTFKFLMSNNTPKIKTALKFWCVLSIYHVLQWVMSHVIAEYFDINKRNIFPVIDLVVLVGLNWNQMEHAETIYNSFIGPTFGNNQQAIQKISSSIQKLFNKKTQGLKEKVAESTSEKLKGFIGDILVGAMNPNLKRQDSSNDEASSRNDEDDQQKDE